ncbi:MAG: protein kinase domain-containing protein [Rubripirellula sp.]
MPDQNPDSSANSPPGPYDPKRLESLAREAEALQSAGCQDPIESVVGKLAKKDREAYRSQLSLRLAKNFRTLDSQAGSPATSRSNPKSPGDAVDMSDDINVSVNAGSMNSVSDDTGHSIDLDTNQTMDRPFGQESETIALPPSRSTKLSRANDKQGLNDVPEFIGKFRIKQELGRGAFGVVYLGYDDELKRNVAIKVSLVSDLKLQERLRVEASKVAQVESNGIVPVYHIGKTDNGKVYFVQKYIEGSTLRDLIKQGPLSPLRAARFIQEIAIGLEPAHSKDIIHRDLKPDNILLDMNGRCWIADFGLAISEDEQQGRRHELAGTPPYMSPEQIMRRVHFLDPRSDIWALGVMYYEMLSGKLPFSGKNVDSLKEQICEQDPRPLHQRAPDRLTESINAVFSRCCAKNPPERFVSVRELAEALEDLIAEGLSDENIHGESMLERFGTDAHELGASHPMISGRRVSASTDTETAVVQTRRSSDDTLKDSTYAATRNWFPGLATLIILSSAAVAGGIGYQKYTRSLASDLEEPTRTKQNALTSQNAVTSSSADSVIEAQISPAPSNTTGEGEPTREISSSTNALNQAAEQIEVVASEDSSKQPQKESRGDEDVPDDARTVSASSGIPTMPEEPKGMSLEEANGTAEKPWVVAEDGLGSHLTIAEALADSPPEAYVRLTPGIYRESLRITSPITIFFAPEVDDGSDALRCNLRSEEASPIEVDCPDGKVTIRNLAIDGEGHKTTQEFNAINVTSGTLILESCEVRTTSFNGVKVHEDAALGARNCRFLDSRDFAISAKDHRNVQVVDSVFLRSGVQIVGGTGSIEHCEFFGIHGCYVSHSERAVTIKDSKFESCQDYAIAVANEGIATVLNCEIEDCELGVNLQNGTLKIADDSKFVGGRSGIGATTGSLTMADVQMTDLDVGIVVTEQAEIDIERLTISRCQTTGITLTAGSMRLHEAQIEDCFAGIQMGDEAAWPKNSATATLTDVKVRRCGNYGVAVFSGPLTLRNIEVSGCQFGLYVQGPNAPDPDRTNSTVQVEISDSTLLQNKQLPLVARGDCSIEFMGEPMPLGSRAIDGAYISELPGGPERSD